MEEDDDNDDEYQLSIGYYYLIWNNFFLCYNAVKQCMYNYSVNLYGVELGYDVIKGNEQIVSS
jgi:hypothetical protein